MKVKVVMLSETREGAKARARGWVEAQGKTVVRFGRVVNRPTSEWDRVRAYEVTMEVERR